MSTMRTLAGTLLAVSAAACGPSITADRNPDVPIPAGATYFLVGGANVGEERDAALQSNIVHERIQKAIHANMQAKGFKQAASEGAATLHVRYAIGVRTETTYQTTGATVGYGGWYGYGWGWGGGMQTTYPVESKKGGGVIDLLDAKSGKLAWRVKVENSAGEKAPSQERVNEVVGEMFKKLQ
ncbi:MAG TPA: DUF4136 domain-containing protein [Gemmatimonadales bacterium]